MPADDATVAITDRIFTAISSEESDGVGQFGAQLLTNTVGLRPLHYVVLWPVVRINPQCVDR